MYVWYVYTVQYIHALYRLLAACVRQQAHVCSPAEFLLHHGYYLYLPKLNTLVKD
jgi:hypothetical protein